MVAPGNIPDAAPNNWVDRLAPVSFRPYLKLSRLDRPIGTWLLLLPCWWSIALAAPPGNLPDPTLFVLFAIGAAVMRGAGCTFNDLVDRDFDARVERTRNRPLPSGAVSPPQAVAWMLAQGLFGLLILWQLNELAILLGLLSLLLVAIYPFMKRITWWPQFFLGLAFNWGALMGYAAVREEVSASAALLYLAGIAWTLGYDTIYAHQDKEDDALIGVRSSARRLGSATFRFLHVVYGGALALLFLIGILEALAWPYWIFLSSAAVHFFWQARSLDINDPADCLRKFRANRNVGFLLLAGIVFGRLFG